MSVEPTGATIEMSASPPHPDHSTSADDRVRARSSEPTLSFRREILDGVVATTMLGVSAWFWFAADDAGDANGALVGPAGFPRGISVVLAFSAVLLLVQGVRRLARNEPGPIVETRRPLNVLAGILLVVAFPALMPRLGYYITMSLFIPAMLLVAGYTKPIGIVLYTVGFLAFTKLLFGMLLRVPLP